MLNCKTINPKIFFIILMLILSIIILNNNISKTLCEEEYQIAVCPNNLFLDSYYITAEDNASALSAVESILLENNFNLDDYDIVIENNIIKVIEKETNEQEKTEIKKQETEEETIIQDNNLIIENEEVTFNEENEIVERNIPIAIPDIFNIKFNDEKINYTLSLQLEEGKQIKLLFVEIQNAIDNNYLDEKVTWKLKDENGNVLTGEEKLYEDIKRGTGVHNYTVEIIKENEEGGTIENEDIRELKEITMCICVLLAINFLYNFASALFNRK